MRTWNNRRSRDHFKGKENKINRTGKKPWIGLRDQSKGPPDTLEEEKWDHLLFSEEHHSPYHWSQNKKSHSNELVQGHNRLKEENLVIKG